jgi:hypothetical protein
VTGRIADFVNKPKLITLCLLLGVAAVLPMLWGNSLWALWFFTALYSVLDASMPVFWASVGDFFGRKSFGTIRDNMNLFYTWGAILGPFIAGAVYDRTQSYQMGLFRNHHSLTDLHRDDSALDQAVGKTWNDCSVGPSLNPFAGLIRLWPARRWHCMLEKNKANSYWRLCCW